MSERHEQRVAERKAAIAPRRSRRGDALSLLLATGAPRRSCFPEQCAPPIGGRPPRSTSATEENALSVLEAPAEPQTALGGSPEFRRRAPPAASSWPSWRADRGGGHHAQLASDVIARIEAYVLERIPECVGVEIEDEAQLDDNAEYDRGLPSPTSKIEEF